MPVNTAFQPQPRCTKHLFGSPWRSTERAGDGMLGAVFQCRRQRQAAIGVQLAQRVNAAQRQAPFGQGAGLVEDDRVDLVEAFEHMTPGQQQAECVQRAGRRSQGGRCRQRQGAGAGGDEHGQNDPERARSIQLPPDHPDQCSRDQRKQQKGLCRPVGDLRESGLFCLCAFEQPDNGRKAGFVTQRRHADGQRAFDIQRSCGDRIAHTARLRQVFAGQQRLIDTGATFEDFAISRYYCAGLHQHPIGQVQFAEHDALALAVIAEAQA